MVIWWDFKFSFLVLRYDFRDFISISYLSGYFARKKIFTKVYFQPRWNCVMKNKRKMCILSEAMRKNFSHSTLIVAKMWKLIALVCEYFFPLQFSSCKKNIKQKITCPGFIRTRAYLLMIVGENYTVSYEATFIFSYKRQKKSRVENHKEKIKIK